MFYLVGLPNRYSECAYAQAQTCLQERKPHQAFAPPVRSGAQ